MKVSVIIPAYNQEVLLKKCLESIPIREDVEIIVVNDGSTDKTKETAYECKRLNPNIKVINSNNNRGVSVARNKGIDKASGEYVLFVDSDDYIDTEIFNDIVDNDLKFVDIVFYDMVDNNGTLYEVNKYRTFNRVGMFKFIKKRFIEDIRFKEGIQVGEDALFHQELMLKMPTITYTNKLMYHYNFPRKGSLTDLYQGKGRDDIKSID